MSQSETDPIEHPPWGMRRGVITAREITARERDLAFAVARVMESAPEVSALLGMEALIVWLRWVEDRTGSLAAACEAIEKALCTLEAA